MIRCAALMIGVTTLAANASAADLGDLLIDHATIWTNELGLHVGKVTGHVVDMTFDMRKLTARVRLGGGTPTSGFHLESDAEYQDGGYLRVHAILEIGVNGVCHQLKLPAIDMSPQDLFGRQMVIVRVPIFERQF